MENSDNNTTQ